MDKKLLSVRDVTNELKARGFDITERAVREEIKALKLRAYKVREKYYITRDDMEEYISASATMPAKDEEILRVG